MSTTIHAHATKAWLIVQIVEAWPEVVVSPLDGSAYRSKQEAVQAVIDNRSEFISTGCPTPNEDGRCPGHKKTNEKPEQKDTEQ